MLPIASVHKDKHLSKKENDDLKGLAKLKIKRSSISAVTHIDFPAHIQTVDAKYNKK